MTDYEVEIEDDEQEEKEFVATYNLSSYGIDFDVSGLVRRMQVLFIFLIFKEIMFGIRKRLQNLLNRYY